MLSTKADSIIKSLPDLSFYDLSKIIIEANTQRDLKCEDDKIQLRNSIITQRHNAEIRLGEKLGPDPLLKLLED
jgi:hypothetical protein